MKNSLKGTIILAVAAVLVCVATYKHLNQQIEDKKACGAQLLDWWLVYQDYRKEHPELQAGSKDPNLGVKLTAHSAKMKKTTPASRCPVHHCPYIFTKEIPGEETLPVTCPKHPDVIRWEKTNAEP